MTFSTLDHVRNPASSSRDEAAPANSAREMSCCTNLRRKEGWRGAATRFVGSGTLLVLLPKCPMCLAAYLTLFTGANVAMSVTMHLRPVIAIGFIASGLLLIVRCASLRTPQATLKRQASR